mmetsp:Transcript_807/g.1009  ORF Transcript_807/g.1009 Transcript_807/m.1009 type:complete len:127 (+) Transcript_807:35-415(+)
MACGMGHYTDHGIDAHGDHHADVAHGCSCSCSCPHCSSAHNVRSNDGHMHGDGHFECSNLSGRAHMCEDSPSGIEDATACPVCKARSVDKCKWAEKCNRKKKCRFCHCGVKRVLPGPTKAKSANSL